MLQPKPKVLFIFSRYSKKEATHYPYWYELIDEVAKKTKFDGAVYFETVKEEPKLLHISKIYKGKNVTRPLNLIIRFWQLIFILKQGYQKVFIHYSYGSLLLIRLIKVCFPKLTIFYWNCEGYERNPHNLLLTASLKLCDVLVTGHQIIANMYRKAFDLKSKPIKIVTNWVRLESVPAKKLFKKKTNVLFVHRLSPRKGSRELPTIINYVLNQNSQIHFHIVGDGPDYLYIKNQLRRSILKHQVTLYGSLPLEKVSSFLKAANYFILPSRQEGFPRVLAEAMVYKLPFIAAKVGCVEKIVSQKQEKYLVPPKKPLIFAQKLVDLIQDKNTKQMVIDNYQQACTYFTKEKAADQLVKILTYEKN